MTESVLGPFQRAPGATAALPLARRESPLVFTARCCGDASSLHWCSGPGPLVPQAGGTLQLGSPADSQPPHLVWGQPVSRL